MPRLTSPPPRLAALPARRADAGAAPRPPGNPLAPLYHGRQWARLRLEILEAAGWMCQACPVPHQLTTGRRNPAAAVVDHIVPHGGDPALFWDRANLQAVCKTYHDGEKQRRERALRDGRGGLETE